VTGTGEVERFGRRVARGLIKLSVAANALERVLMFPAMPALPEGKVHTAQERAVAQIQLLVPGPQTAGADEITTPELVATWLMLMVSVCIGVVFPLLA
jgi:hypothetical protein